MLLLVVAPFASLWWVIGVTEAAATRRELAAAEEELADLTARLGKLASAKSYYQEVVERLARSFAWRTPQAPILERLPPGTSLFLFDEHGRRLAHPGFRRDLQVVSQRFLSALVRLASEPTLVMTKAERQVGESFAGDAECLLRLARNQGRLCDLRPLGIDRLGGWFPVRFRHGRPGSLVVWIEASRIPRRRLVRQAVERLQVLTGPRYRFAWLHLDRPRQHGTGRGRRVAARWLPILRRPRLSGILRVAFPSGSPPGSPAEPASSLHGGAVAGLPRDDVLLGIHTLAEGFRVVAGRRVPRPPRQFAGWRALLVVLGVEAVLAALWQAVFGVSLTLSVRTQLIGIFGLAGLAGLGALLGVSQIYRESRQEALIRESQQHALSTLEKIDGAYSSAFSFLVREYRELTQRLISTDRPPAEVMAPLRRWHAEGLIDMVCLIDQHEKVVFRLPETVPAYAALPVSQNLFTLLQNLAVQILRKTGGGEAAGAAGRGPGEPETSEAVSGPVPLEAGTPGSGAVELSADEASPRRRSMFSILLDRPIDDLIKNRAGLQQVSLAGEQKAAFVDLAYGADGKPRYCLLVLHDRKVLQERHLRHIQGVFQRNSSFRVLAFPQEEESGVPALGDPEQLAARDVVRLRELVSQTRTVAHRQGRLGVAECLLSAMPGRTMSEYALALVTPFGPIAERARAISQTFGLLTVISLLFTLLLSIRLAGALLGPIRELTTGIEDLTSLRLDRPVQIATGDELEEIGKGLNAIMAEMQELALARTVQEQLLPAGPLRVGALEVQGWMRPASDVGGELFDYLGLADGRLAFMVADVSGQGISSALVMAMGKMALRLHLDTEAPVPAAVLRAVDQHLRLHVRRLANVAVFLGLADPATGIVTYTGAGSSQAFHVAREGRVHALPVGAIGLGAAHYPVLEDRQLALGPGDRLVICTDGLLSGATAGPEDRGEPRQTVDLPSRLATVATQPLDRVGPALFQALEVAAGRGATPEDQTLLVVERAWQERSA
ncbi:MAG: Serine phosphatase RsbU, regulator of sigma subunit [Candidatus Ozemobacter sibiricus]|jgi:hypothetical protein|uniref:Serine phosphatase RsbU, regulator of sigma subunit n=1 Tax=Candidatus Ozemobacter sibiricus TaxID=2268124 RepID=A0A367ZQ03_9BACT|nr:MAG: Serine phosphatase RsbU, regulator of sigma subunit [Candidatus Ozemobacter sibiricus]